MYRGAGRRLRVLCHLIVVGILPMGPHGDARMMAMA